MLKITYPDLANYRITSAGPDKMVAFSAVTKTSKTLKSGKSYYIGCARHLAVEQCPVMAVGFHLMVNHFIKRIPFPNVGAGNDLW